MSKRLFLSLLISIALFSGCSKSSSNTGPGYASLTRFIGTYPCNKVDHDAFVTHPVVRKELQKVLAADFKKYEQFLAGTGCGMVAMRDSVIISDMFHLHVDGGNTSILFFDIPRGQTHVFWMNGTLKDGKAKIYGQRPVPLSVQQFVETAMNTGWSHLAEFKVTDGMVSVKLNSEKADGQ